jgi:hypothetical protein
MHGGRKYHGGIVIGVDRSSVFPEVLAFDIEPASTEILGDMLGDTPSMTFSRCVQYGNCFRHFDML